MCPSAPLLGAPTSRVRLSRSRALLLIAGGTSALVLAGVAPGSATADAAATTSSQLTCDGKHPTIYAGPDVTGTITGTRRDDVILVVSDRIAWSGNSRQVIDAKMGDDRVCTVGGWNYQVDGGPGDDRIWTGDGDDHISGGLGRDKMTSGAGDDLIVGTPFGSGLTDRAYCGDGQDIAEKVSTRYGSGCEVWSD
jgi:Ca2+-binding RTX toxin-like protein